MAEQILSSEKEATITLSVNKFKEILIYSWHLLPQDKQEELIRLGVYPGKKLSYS
jgi:hypothetical protein